MPKWEDFRRFLKHNAKLLRHGGKHDIYFYDDHEIRVSRSSGEIKRTVWRDILKHQLGITYEEFKARLK